MSNLRTLMFHDVVFKDQFDSSGFPGNDSATYKLTQRQFSKYLNLLKNGDIQSPVIIENSIALQKGGWVLSFDDGGVSAFDNVLTCLNQFNWRAHFFVTTDYIGKKGFLDKKQIVILREQGHSIGSHSCSHPNMTKLDRHALRTEWKKSLQILSEIISEPINMGAVPGGHYNYRVAQVAEESGVRYLFTSTPFMKVKYVGRCAVIGRYGIKSSTPINLVLKLAQGDVRAWLFQKIIWDTKKIVQSLFGNNYSILRKYYYKIKFKN